MHNLKIEFYLKFIFLVSLIATISSFYIEYILGHQACNLCLIERILYVLSLTILIVNYQFKKKQKYVVFLLIIIFVFSLLVSMYHFGIEQGFFQESLLCDLKNASNTLSKEEILKELQKKTVSCKDVTFRIFGFSLATINVVISLIVSFILIKIMLHNEKIK